MSTRLLFLALFFPALLTQAFSQKLQTVMIDGKEAVAGELIVKLKPQTTTPKVAQIASKALLLRQCGATIARGWMTGAELWRVPPEDTERALNILNQSPLVQYAYPNYYGVKADGNPGRIPNDPLFNKQWHLLNTGQGGGISGADIKATEAWDITTGDSTIVVAVLDSGVDIDHPDLKNNIWNNKNEIPGNGKDDDGNGYIDDTFGWDFVENNNNPRDKYFHGTACAGLIAASQNNNIGISGVAPAVKIMVVRHLGANGLGTIAAGLSAAEYAIQNGAKILNCSYSHCYQSWGERDMFSLANERGILVVASAGNCATDLEGPYDIAPAMIDLPNIVSVGSSSQCDERSSFSNYGQNQVDVVAPGSATHTTLPNEQYGDFSGTSASAPVVSGVAALVWSVYPNLTVAQMRQQLMLSSDILPSLHGVSSSNGRVNARKAVSGLYLSPLSVPTRSVSFGVARLGYVSTGRSLIIKNDSEVPISVDSIVVAEGFTFSATDTSAKKRTAVQIGPKDSVAVTFYFAPSAQKEYRGHIFVYDANSYGQTVQMVSHLGGYGVSAGSFIDVSTVSGRWTKAASPYYINRNVTVSGTLVLEPGTKVLAAKDVAIDVTDDSQLRAVGSPSDSITFSAAVPPEGWGGILFLNSKSDDTLSYCVIEYATGKGSYLSASGGAVQLRGTRVLISDCRFRKNGSTTCVGGAVSLFNTRAIIKNCVFYENEGFDGGALSLSGADSSTVANLLFYNNRARYGGGAIYIQQSNVTLSNITAYQNISGGGVAMAYANSSVEFVNSIFWKNYDGDRDPAVSHPFQFVVAGGSSPVTMRLRYCIVDTFPKWYDVQNSTVSENRFILDKTVQFSDPMFADTTLNDFRLRPNSPGIDAGAPSYDVGNEPFPHGYRINLGYDGGTPSATTSWESKLAVGPESIDFGFLNQGSNLTKDLLIRNGVNVQLTVSEISLSNSADFVLTNPPTFPLTVASGQTITLKLTFRPTSVRDSLLSCIVTVKSNNVQYEVAARGRILLGTVLAGPNVQGTLLRSGSPYLVTQNISVGSGSTFVIEPGVQLRFAPGTSMSVLQGGRFVARGTEKDSITFTSATADGWSGIVFTNSGGDDEISYCVFSGAKIQKSTSNLGAGVIRADYSSPTILRSVFRNNQLTDVGGILNLASTNAPSRIEHLLFEDNSTLLGGALQSSESNGRYENLVIRRHTATDRGLITLDCTSPTLNNVLIADNDAVGLGLVSIRAESLAMNNLTIVRNKFNRSAVYGGSIFEYYRAKKIVIRNTIVWDNLDQKGNGASGAIWMPQTADVPQIEIFNSDIDTIGLKSAWSTDPGANAPNLVWKEGNLCTDPLFVDKLNGDFSLSAQSKCINVGTADTSGLSLPVSDLNGNYRIAGGRIDMGAYESGSGKAPTVLPPSPPVLAGPTDGAGSQQSSPTLRWNEVSEATSYQLQVSTTASFSTTVVNDSMIVATSKSIGPLSLNTTYYWRVRSKNEAGTSVWSATRSFTTVVAVPSAPTLAGPADSAINVQLTTALRWSVSAGATLYHLQVSTASGFTAFVVNDSTVSDTSKSIGPLSLATTYYWRVRAKNEGGWGVYSSARRFSTIRTTAVEQMSGEIPTEYSLSQNFPNPFNPTTKLRFGIPNAGFVTLKVFDLLGRELETLVAEELSAGYYQATWRANVPSGIYFYRLQAGEYSETKKMILVR